MITSTLILLCVVSRALAIPGYLRILEFASFGERTASALHWVSVGFLFGSGAAATGLIMYFVLRAWFRELKVFRKYRPAIKVAKLIKGTLEKLA